MKNTTVIIVLSLTLFYTNENYSFFQDSSKSTTLPGPHDPIWKVGNSPEIALALPDSIMDTELDGYASFTIGVHKTGKFVGYKINQIGIWKLTKEQRNFQNKPNGDQKNLPPPIAFYSVHEKKQNTSSDSLKNKIRPLIELFYQALEPKFIVNKNNPSFKTRDTLWMSSGFEFGGGILKGR